MSWSDERVEILRKLWVDGLSASQIAKQLGGVTRNAVIGKVHRLGLAGRATPSRPIPNATRKRPAAVAKPVIVEVEAIEPIIEEVEVITPIEPVITSIINEPTIINVPKRDNSGALIGVLDLMPNMCKWPIGDPTDPEFGFCGAKSHASWPYCKEHGEIAYQPQMKKGNNQPTTIAEAVEAEKRKAV
jgi:GcrA cell cycle regulator